MSGWQLTEDAPTSYARYASHIMEPWTDDLILSGQCRTGDRVLDVACGTGFVASRVNLASKAECKVVGIDVNEAMLNTARKNPLIEWHTGSATELPFETASFDVVLCQQGLQYFPDRSAATKEMARVLVPGGRVAANVWGPLDRQVFHSAVVNGIGAFFGADVTKAFDLAFSLNTVAGLRDLARDAGFKEVKVKFEHRTIRHPDVAEMTVGFMQSTPIASQFQALPAEKRKAFVDYVTNQLRGYVDDAGLAAPLENHFLTATR